MIEKLRLLPVKDVIAANGGPLPMSLAGVYAAIKRGEIASVKIGRRVFIVMDSLENKLNVAV